VPVYGFRLSAGRAASPARGERSGDEGSNDRDFTLRDLVAELAGHGPGAIAARRGLH